MVLATPAVAQTPKTGTIKKYTEIEAGAIIYVKPEVKWNADRNAWKVDYSVDIDLKDAREAVQCCFSQAAIDELEVNIARYNGKPWYQMRYANTYQTSAVTCFKENPSAYNSELIGGTGWYRSFFVAPGEKTCLTVWMYGDSIFSPKGTIHNFGNPYPMGVAYFVGPPAPSP